jgi:hypothetical protein
MLLAFLSQMPMALAACFSIKVVMHEVKKTGLTTVEGGPDLLTILDR